MGLGVIDVALAVEGVLAADGVHGVDDGLVVGHLVDGVHHLAAEGYVLHHGRLAVAVDVLLVGGEAELRPVAHLIDGVVKQVLGVAVLVEGPEVVYLQRVALCIHLAVGPDAEDAHAIVALHDVERGLGEVGEHLLRVVVVWAFLLCALVAGDDERVGKRGLCLRHVHLLAGDELYAAGVRVLVVVGQGLVVGQQGDALDGVFQRGQQGRELAGE